MKVSIVTLSGSPASSLWNRGILRSGRIPNVEVVYMDEGFAATDLADITAAIPQGDGGVSAAIGLGLAARRRSR